MQVTWVKYTGCWYDTVHTVEWLILNDRVQPSLIAGVMDDLTGVDLYSMSHRLECRCHHRVRRPAYQTRFYPVRNAMIMQSLVLCTVI